MQDSNVTRTWEDTIDFVTQRTKVQGETKIQQPGLRGTVRKFVNPTHFTYYLLMSCVKRFEIMQVVKIEIQPPDLSPCET